MLNKKAKSSYHDLIGKQGKAKVQADYTKVDKQGKHTLKPDSKHKVANPSQASSNPNFRENELEIKNENSSKRIDETEVDTVNHIVQGKSDPKSESLVEKESLKDLAKSKPRLDQIKKLNHQGSQSQLISKRIEITRLSKDKGNPEYSAIKNNRYIDQSGDHKRGKFRRNRNTYKKKLIFFTVVFCFLVATGFGLSFLPVPMMTSSVKTTLTFTDRIVGFSSDVKLIYFVFLESIVSKQDVLVNGVALFAQLMTKISNSNNYISQNIGSIPSGFSSFGSSVKDLIFNNMCEVLLKQKHRISSKLFITVRL